MTINYQISFEPNLDFTSNLNEDLKTNYFEQYEKAKQLVEKYKSLIKDVVQQMVHFGEEWSKIQADQIEANVNKKLQEKIDLRKSASDIHLNGQQSSEILGASPNCNIKRSKISPTHKLNLNADNEIFKNQKENFEKISSFESNDFNYNMEDDYLVKHKSPSKLVSSPDQFQSSPILGKKKKISKRNTSSASNNSSSSITLSNDCKTGSSAKVSPPRKLFVNNDKNEVETKLVKEPLKPVDNTLINLTSKSQEKNKNHKILSVSKTSYHKTEFSENKKKLRQATLTLKHVPPIIDLGKIDTHDNYSYESYNKFKNNSFANDTFYNNNKNCDKKIEDSKKFGNFQFKSNSKFRVDGLNETDKQDPNQSTKDDELIEISPIQKECSRLRSKLSIKKLPEINQIKIKDPIKINNEVLLNINNSETSNNYKKDDLKNSNLKTIEVKSQKNFLCDETYFSPAEHGFSDKNTNEIEYDIDESDFQDEIEFTSPPAKKILLDSFDCVPGRKQKSPEYAYKETPVRNKNERAQLPGWGCRECENYYACLPEEERMLRKNKCSKHRGKFKQDAHTPESFWNPVFDDIMDSSNE